ncbi:M3 family metallopeptidase, partial [Xanthomonas citri pv. citri]
LGIASYSDYALATKKAGAPADVLAFQRDLAAKARPHAEKDRHALETFAREQLGIEALQERVRGEVAVNHPPAWNRFPHQFSHIFAGGYAAGYYSYKWAEVLCADAYAAFEEAPGAVAETGARYRDEVHSRGGSRSAAENFQAFRGRAPNIDALLRHAGM